MALGTRLSSHLISVFLTCREEQYRSLWTELENLLEVYSSSSERHRHLFEFLLGITAQSPCMQSARKTPPIKSGKYVTRFAKRDYILLFTILPIFKLSYLDDHSYIRSLQLSLFQRYTYTPQ